MQDQLQAIFADDAPLLAMLRSGLEGLSDAEYCWEPVEGCWSVRPVSELGTPAPPWATAGDYAIEISYPDPSPSPFTTIAWRLVHLTGSVNVAAATLEGKRRPDGAIANAWEAGSQPTPAAAQDAVHMLDDAIERLQAKLSTATGDDLLRTERQWWDPPDHRSPVWNHVLFFGYFESSSHGAEIRLLRDLYRHTQGGTTPLRPAR